MSFRKSLLAVVALSCAVASFSPVATTAANAAPAAKAAVAAKAAPAATAAAAAAKVDINTATKEQLMALPGIGDAIADKIIAGRPFANKHQLLDKKLVNAGQYKAMSSHIIASGGMASGAAKTTTTKAGANTTTTTKKAAATK